MLHCLITKPLVPVAVSNELGLASVMLAYISGTEFLIIELVSVAETLLKPSLILTFNVSDLAPTAQVQEALVKEEAEVAYAQVPAVAVLIVPLPKASYQIVGELPVANCAYTVSPAVSVETFPKVRVTVAVTGDSTGVVVPLMRKVSDRLLLLDAITGAFRSSTANVV